MQEAWKDIKGYGVTQADIGRNYGVTRQCIWQINKNNNWGWL